jgi:hypothetical protein
MKPRIPITSKDFVYRQAHKTDVRETWRLARERDAAQQKVVPITKGKS